MHHPGLLGLGHVLKTEVGRLVVAHRPCDPLS
jgi:hypothetical protein